MMAKGLLIRTAIAVIIGAALGAGMGAIGRCTSGTCPLTSTPWRGAAYGAFLGVLVALSSAGSRPG